MPWATAIVDGIVAGVVSSAVAAARTAGITGFWNLFRTGYVIAFIVSVADFRLLNVRFRDSFKDRILIKGTESCKSWETRAWLASMAIREHLLW